MKLSDFSRKGIDKFCGLKTPLVRERVVKTPECWSTVVVTIEGVGCPLKVFNTQIESYVVHRRLPYVSDHRYPSLELLQILCVRFSGIHVDQD
jgi:hypothetical protein